MQLDQITSQWSRNGYVIIPNFIGIQEILALQNICDHILEQVIDEEVKAKGKFEDRTNIAYLTEYKYFKNDLNSLIELLEFIGDYRIISILKWISGETPLLQNTQYFYNPRYSSWQGKWHRDTQFLAPEPEIEKLRMQQFTGVHFRVAFLDDSLLEYVPGSEQRWDTEDELRIRKGDNPQQSHMPGSKRIILKAGDACIFHAWGVHRGSYQEDIPRRTLDIIYRWGGLWDYCPPSPMCFADLSILDNLSHQAKEFFSYFVNTYQEYWVSER